MKVEEVWMNEKDQLSVPCLPPTCMLNDESG